MVGRNNWMFAGGALSARRVCAILSRIETRKLLGVYAGTQLAWMLRGVVPRPDNRGYQASDLPPTACKKALRQGFG